jgi:hypothetical protein
MKRGLIQWDRAELPAATFEARLERVRAVLTQRELPALLVYSDVWRSNHGRFLTNFMPYWNRSLILIPADQSPVLLCGLSPRVYPWIRSVTVFEEVRPASNLIAAVTQLCTERGWKELAVLDLSQLPRELYDPLHRSDIGLLDVAAHEVITADEAELRMRRRAASLAREVLANELPKGAGLSDYEFTARLECALRLRGAEDLVIQLSTGRTSPRPASGATLGDSYSVSLALEYCGHWVRVTRAQAPPDALTRLRERFESALADPSGAYAEDLSGPCPFESINALSSPALTLQIEVTGSKGTLFYGDTCRNTGHGIELL